MGLESLPKQILGMTEGFGELDGVRIPTWKKVLGTT